MSVPPFRRLPAQPWAAATGGGEAARAAAAKLPVRWTRQNRSAIGGGHSKQGSCHRLV